MGHHGAEGMGTSELLPVLPELLGACRSPCGSHVLQNQCNSASHSPREAEGLGGHAPAVKQPPPHGHLDMQGGLQACGGLWEPEGAWGTDARGQ